MIHRVSRRVGSAASLSLLLCTFGSAQFRAAGALGAALKTLHDDSLFPQYFTSPNPQTTLGAKGFSAAEKPKDPSRPPPNDHPQNEIQVVPVPGSNLKQTEGGEILLTHGAEVLYRGYRMTGEAITGNRYSKVFIITGNAKLVGGDALVNAERITVDFTNKTYETYEGESDLKPSLVGGILLSDLYADGKHTSGTDFQTFVNDAILTTCDYELPHYELRAKYADVKYGKRILLRGTDLYILRKHILHLPFLVLPLQDRTYNNLPYFGQSPYEGYFVKSRYGFPITGDRSLDARLDLMTKIGVGVGGDYLYAIKTAKQAYDGKLSVYTVSGTGTVDISQEQEGTFRGGRYQLQTDYNGHDYLINPDGVLLSQRALVTFLNKKATTTFTFYRNDNSTLGFSTQQETLGVNDTRSFNTLLKTQVQLTYNDTASAYTGDGATSSSDTDRRTIDVNLQAADDLKKATAVLEYQRSVPIGSIQNFYGITERTPNLILKTSGLQLLGPTPLAKYFNFTSDASIGQFSDPTTAGAITRDHFDFNFSHTDDSRLRARFDYNGSFSQGIYSDSTAQYALGLGGAFTYRLGKDTSANFRYNYLRPEGYSPLGIDQTGKLNLATEDISFRVARPLLLGVQTGYDANQVGTGTTPWEPVGLRAEYSPAQWFFLRNLTTYDPFIHEFANLRWDLSYKPGATFVGVGARYDATRHTWAETDLYISALKIGRFKMDVRATFDGFSGRFDNQQVSAIYDLHDAELVMQVINNLTGFNNGAQYVIFIRLKALPFDNFFGTGVRGQGIGTGTGVGY